MRGVKIDLLDCKIHEEAAHKSADQVVPAVSRAIRGTVLCASPILVEPYFQIQVTVPLQLVSPIHSILSNRRGSITDQEEMPGDAECQLLTGVVPVGQSFGLTQELREKTKGQAFMTADFSHWENVPGDVYDANSCAGKVAREVRARKKLTNPEIPLAKEFMDKL
jgi:elongation factor 2